MSREPKSNSWNEEDITDEDEELDIELDIEETKDIAINEEIPRAVKPNQSTLQLLNEERGGWGELDDDVIIVCEEVKLDQAK